MPLCLFIYVSVCELCGGGGLDGGGGVFVCVRARACVRV